MAPITVTTEVNRPAGDVFAYATDPTHFSEWQKGVVEGHMEEGNGTHGLGAKYVTTRRIGMSNRSSSAEVHGRFFSCVKKSSGVYLEGRRTHGHLREERPSHRQADA